MKINKPKCKLVGTDGNVFSIISKVAATLDKNKLPDMSTEFSIRAFTAGSYDEVLQICAEYVTIS